MKNLYKIEWFFPVSALFVLAFFYGTYFVKKILQSRKGIQTRQIGKRKEKEVHAVEILMSIATLLCPAAELVSIALNWSVLPDNARFTGFLVGIIGDVIFLLAVIFMRDSWRAGIPDKDKTELVTEGIYKLSRNPAFLGFDFMYVGLLLMYGNVITLVFTLFAVIMLHLQILQEERYLESTFGEAYTEYKKQVFRYLGRRSGGKRG